MKFINISAVWPLLFGLAIGAMLGGALGFFGQCASGTCPFTSTWWRGAIFGGILGIIIALSPSGRELRNDNRQQNQPSADTKEHRALRDSPL